MLRHTMMALFAMTLSLPATALTDRTGTANFTTAKQPLSYSRNAEKSTLSLSVQVPLLVKDGDKTAMQNIPFQFTNVAYTFVKRDTDNTYEGVETWFDYSFTAETELFGQKLTLQGALYVTKLEKIKGDQKTGESTRDDIEFRVVIADTGVELFKSPILQNMATTTETGFYVGSAPYHYDASDLSPTAWGDADFGLEFTITILEKRSPGFQIVQQAIETPNAEFSEADVENPVSKESHHGFLYEEAKYKVSRRTHLVGTPLSLALEGRIEYQYFGDVLEPRYRTRESFQGSVTVLTPAENGKETSALYGSMLLSVSDIGGSPLGKDRYGRYNIRLEDVLARAQAVVDGQALLRGAK